MPQDSERRKYLRLDSVLPVQFRLLSLDGKIFLSDWLQGFTCNISKGGIGLSINNLNPATAELIKSGQAKFCLQIEMPLTKGPVGAIAGLAHWEQVNQAENRYFAGLSYEDIDKLQNLRILRYARTKRYFAPWAMAIILLLFIGFALDGYLNLRLVRGNKALVEQLIKILQESSVAKQKIKEITREREELKTNIQGLEMRIRDLGQEKTLNKDESKKTSLLNFQIEKLIQEKASLQDKLIGLQSKESVVTEELLMMDKRKAVLEKANLDKMYHWLSVHQNPRTGLVMSFEGDSDIAEWAFVYDQSLVVQAYTLFSDFPRAKKILDFFDKKAKRIDGRFINAYYVKDGAPAEYTVHCGPNLWLGIAVLQYTKKSQDLSYLPMAEDIAEATIYLQDQDAEGGLKGGPNTDWYATEHNLDGYAFFNMLYKLTGKQRYVSARDKVLNWLLLHAYDQPDIPIKRGKGDATIATDTYAWSIAAIGPQKLQELNLNPDQIVEFAEQNCAVEVNYLRPDGQSVKIKGFDFAPKQHLSRGGVVSPEWTSQMIMAFKILADYYYKKDMVAKARGYEQKADEYLAQLGNLLISSPSPSGQGEGCLPYATQEAVDTGHGWITPKGKATGSIAGTAYTLFAYYNYNPLDLKD